ncbi:hypothetical protein K474DRAFT_1667936 [Panus rudis PR-1116 ss-1]|nr:hypothetical protein K474DRAFT_1667936 [Panus rudis PR-1116 ss-1]
MSAEDVQKKLDEAIANANEHPLDDATQKKAMDELAGKVADSNDDIIEEIKALAQYTLDIEKAMGEIDDIFRKIQLGDVSAGLKEDVQYLRDTWSGHINTYVGLLWESRRVAGAAEGAANDFAGDFITFLGEESTPMDEKKKEISNYLEKLANDEKQATTMSQGFSNLQKAVQDFQKDWKTIVDKYDLDDMNEQATKLQGEIDTLTTTLASLGDKIQKLAIALGILAASAAITGALGFIFPLFWIGTVLSVLGAGVSAVLLKQTKDAYDPSETETELNEKKAELKRLMADIAAVQELKAGLENSQGNFDVIITRLGAFATVWATIRADIQAIEEKLEYAHNTGSWTLMKGRLNTAAKLYAALGKALRQYQISVNPDQKMFKARNLA